MSDYVWLVDCCVIAVVAAAAAGNPNFGELVLGCTDSYGSEPSHILQHLKEKRNQLYKINTLLDRSEFKFSDFRKSKFA